MSDTITATLRTRANVYFDGPCVSHSLGMADDIEVAQALHHVAHFD